MSIEEAITDAEPTWRTFTKLHGFSDEQSDLFCEAYADAVRALPTDQDKAEAIDSPDPVCLTLALGAAGIVQ